MKITVVCRFCLQGHCKYKNHCIMAHPQHRFQFRHPQNRNCAKISTFERRRSVQILFCPRSLQEWKLVSKHPPAKNQMENYHRSNMGGDINAVLKGTLKKVMTGSRIHGRVPPKTSTTLEGTSMSIVTKIDGEGSRTSPEGRVVVKNRENIIMPTD